MDTIVNPKVREYVEGLVSFPEFSEMETYAKANHVPIVMKDAGEFLRFIVSTAKPAEILELGTAIGYSSILMAKSSPASSIVTVERSEVMRDIAEKNIANYDLSGRISVILSECDRFLMTSEKLFDFIFIDAGKSHYQEYLDLCLPRLSRSGIILCDNVLYQGLVAHETVARKHRTNVTKLREFMAYVYGREDLITSTLTVGDGMLLIRRKEL
jgi:predicted O-methyltransferase YrrM